MDTFFSDSYSVSTVQFYKYLFYYSVCFSNQDSSWSPKLLKSLSNKNYTVLKFQQKYSALEHELTSLLMHYNQLHKSFCPLPPYEKKKKGTLWQLRQCSKKLIVHYFKMSFSLSWPTKKRFFSYNKTTFIGADRTNVWSKTVYFPNPSHDVFLVPRCRRQFSWCCSPRPMSKRIW